MFKQILMVTLLICLAHSEGDEWIAWNTFAANNQNLVSQYQRPSIPTPTPNSGSIIRVQDSSPYPLFQYRANQYKYIYTPPIVIPGKCNIYCGLRSFLTVTSNGLYVCQRDKSPQFWGAYSQAVYASYCIPDVDYSTSCRAFQSTLGNVGGCNPLLYKNTGYQNMQCCYNDRNVLVSPGTNPDLTTRYPSSGTTSYFALRTAEP